jgi:hypothetical protein
MAQIDVILRMGHDGELRRLARYSIYLVRGKQDRVYAVLSDRWFGPMPRFSPDLYQELPSSRLGRGG